MAAEQLQPAPERRSGLTFQELLDVLSGDNETAQGIWNSWGDQPPEDPEKNVRHAHAWSNYDRQRGLLNRQHSDGSITDAQYWQAEDKLYRQAQAATRDPQE